ncbi:DUF397 domain-containing protein [Plantactinospora sp. KLBMP9567]|uniref:DUF397 domain-containing protein n=1 Tax=Plantactinospora sp. KLBMP9567 TaxID=3085900 RepID=UPI00298239D9|nr:DUF397 domain-containing protein [Plantactinospora sp. KLBMP9567]MDW5323327.1 DUF397 domain-containing protein [Plantactinospora sp. KLBMP9567]
MAAGNAEWRKSSRSNSNGGDCVEVAGDLAPGVVGVRDSKDRQGPVLTFGSSAWRTFLRGVATR